MIAKPPTILVIADEPHSIGVLRLNLEMSDFRVITISMLAFTTVQKSRTSELM